MVAERVMKVTPGLPLISPPLLATGVSPAMHLPPTMSLSLAMHEPVPPTAYRTVGLLAAPMRLVSAISAAAMKGLSTLRRTITWTGWHSRVT